MELDHHHLLDIEREAHTRQLKIYASITAIVSMFISIISLLISVMKFMQQ